MTFNEYLTEYLRARGIWPAEAESIIAQYVEGMAGVSIQQRMNDDIEGYPDQLLSVVLVGIRREVVVWIDANKPKHFAREIFV